MFSINRFYTDIAGRYKECDFAFIPVLKLESREKNFFMHFMPEAKTAIVLFFGVKNQKDWIWNCSDGTMKTERCNIDDRCYDICVKIKKDLESWNLNTKIVPYPQQSGLQFRFVAAASGIGEIGKSAFYLHPYWGPWVHLRVLATEAGSPLLCSIKLKTEKVCLDCNKCINQCPALAFENGFNGLQCRAYRKEKGEYEPIGPKGILRYCRKCVLVCKAGKKSAECI